MKLRLVFLSIAALLVCSCGKAPRESLTLSGFAKPEEVLARYMAAEPAIVERIGVYEGYSVKDWRLMSSSGGVLRPGRKLVREGGILRLQGSLGTVDIDYDIHHTSDKRWVVDKLELSQNQPDPMDP